MTINRLYSIGEMAKKTEVTTRTLRYYEKLNLIKPDLIKENGYRYYSEKTANIIPVIKYLQFMDLNLKQIKSFINDENYFDKMKSFKKLIEMSKKNIEELEEKITIIEDWYKLIDESCFIHLIDEVPIKIKYLEKQNVIRYGLEFDFDYKNLILNVYFANFVKKNNTRITDAVMVYFPFYKDRIQNEIDNRKTKALVVQKTVNKLKNRENSLNIEEGFYLSTYHKGSHKNIIESYNKAKIFAKEKDYILGENSIERFVLDYWTTTNEDDFVTEILLPIKNNTIIKEK